MSGITSFILKYCSTCMIIFATSDEKEGEKKKTTFLSYYWKRSSEFFFVLYIQRKIKTANSRNTLFLVKLFNW
jgi:hypothetical protein